MRRITLKFCMAYGACFGQVLVNIFDRVMSGHGAMTSQKVQGHAIFARNNGIWHIRRRYRGNSVDVRLPILYRKLIVEHTGMITNLSAQPFGRNSDLNVRCALLGHSPLYYKNSNACFGTFLKSHKKTNDIIGFLS